MKFLRNEEGFTLIEVIASIIILSISLLLFSNFFVQNYRISKGQDSQMIAMNLARQTAEEWKAHAPEELKDFFDSENPYIRNLNPDVPFEINGRFYERELKIEDLANGNPNITSELVLLLTVTVKEAKSDKILAVLHTGVPYPEESET